MLVEGVAGSGKSALVRRWLEASTARTVCIEIRPGDRLADALSLLAVGLGALPAKHGTEDAYLASAVERAESLEAVCVVEDLHRLATVEAKRLLRQLALNAVHSRWVLTGRGEYDALAGVGSVRLGALSSEDSRQLAETVGVTLPSHDAQLTPMEVLRAAELDALSPASSNPLLQHLSLVDLALSLDDLAQLGPMPSEELFSQLASKGLLVRTSDGYRLHDQVRTAISASLQEEERRELERTQAQRLGSSDRPQTTLEALRAMMAANRSDDAATLAAERRQPLIRAGQGSRLWRLLSQAESGGLRHQAFEVAASIATPEALTWLQAQPKPAEPSTRLRWLEGLLIAGQRQLAQRGTQELLDGTISKATRSEATLLLARIALTTGAVDRARRLLATVEPVSDGHRWRAEALRATASMMFGDLQDALRRAWLVRDASAGLAIDDALVVRADIEPIWLEAGQAGDTRGPLEETATASNRQLQALRAMSMTAKADPAGAQRLVDALTKARHASPGERAKVQLAAAGVAVATGNMAALSQHLEVALASARESQDWHIYQWAMAARASFAFLAGWPEPVAPWADGYAPPTGIHALNLRAATHLAALEAGEPSPYSTDDLTSEELRGESTVVMGFCRAVAQLLEGDVDGAAVSAERSIARVRSGGWAAYVLVAFTAACAVYLVRRDRPALIAAARQFYDKAIGSGVELARMAAEFFVEAAQANPQLPVVVRIAASASVAPRQAHWAQSLLGIAQPKGVLSQLLVDATREMWGDLRIVHIQGPEPGGVGWSVDVASGLLWLPEADEPINVRRFRQFKRFVQYLADNGGRATLEQLATDVWDVSEYHSVRDENRMRVAVFRFRELVGDDKEAPYRLVTVEGGYALGADEPVTVAWRDTTR